MNRIKFIVLALALCIVTHSDTDAQSLRRITVYIQNPTSNWVPFQYQMGGDDWKKIKIQSGHTMTMTGIANHRISFQDGQGDVVNYTFNSSGTSYFMWSQGVLGLRRRTN